MKTRTFLLVLLAVAVSCRERPQVLRDTIPYVKQLAADSTGTFSLVRSYRTAGTRGSIAVIGEPESAWLLSQAFLEADFADNVDGKPAPDRLPDFAGEQFDVLLDDYNAPYLRMARSCPDSLREVTVRNVMIASDTVCFVTGYDTSTRLRKNRSKVFVFASSLLSGYGQFDVDTLFKMADREALVLTPVEAMIGAAKEAGMKSVAVWAPAEARAVYESVAAGQAPGLLVTVISTEGNDLRASFRDFLREYRAARPGIRLDAVLLDSFSADLPELKAEQEHIHRQITEEDMSFDSMLAPEFRFMEPTTCMTHALYRLLRGQNLFTHNIAYPAARYFGTEEGMEGEYLPVEIGAGYLPAYLKNASSSAY